MVYFTMYVYYVHTILNVCIKLSNLNTKMVNYLIISYWMSAVPPTLNQRILFSVLHKTQYHIKQRSIRTHMNRQWMHWLKKNLINFVNCAMCNVYQNTSLHRLYRFWRMKLLVIHIKFDFGSLWSNWSIHVASDITYIQIILT